MVSVSQKALWCQRLLERIERERNKGDKHAVARICGYYRVPVKSAYDWLNKWDGTWQSLAAKSHRPHRHPHAHTDAEIQTIIAVTRECGYLPPLLMYQELYERGYKRSYGGMKRFIRKHFATPKASAVLPEKPKEYEGGTYPGERVQIDVKYVPKDSLFGERLFQYTLLDEYSRWCYREIHGDINSYTASLFLRSAVKAAPFKIHEVQTDNGYEFTNALLATRRHLQTHFEASLVALGIKYRRIRVRTPKHNGRVERQHGLDMLRFYKNQKFVSMDDVRKKVHSYNIWSNTRFKTCLMLRSPIQTIMDYAT